MQHDREYLLDILEAARLAMRYIQEKTRDEFLEDMQCQDAVVRRLEIIGEAARRLSNEARATIPDLPWSEMVGMRNLMIHEYDDVDMVIVWETVTRDLPKVAETLSRILG